MKLVKISRWRLDYRAWRAPHFARRSGGQCTPGPWWEVVVPAVGGFVLSQDRTLFGWSDKANNPG